MHLLLRHIFDGFGMDGVLEIKRLAVRFVISLELWQLSG